MLFSVLLFLYTFKVIKHRSERYAKRHNSWDHFVAMLFCQLAKAKSLRETCEGLACCMGKLLHLEMKGAPNKSTLSYAIAHRPWEMFRDLFYDTLQTCKMTAPSKHMGRAIYIRLFRLTDGAFILVKIIIATFAARHTLPVDR